MFPWKYIYCNNRNKIIITRLISSQYYSILLAKNKIGMDYFEKFKKKGGICSVISPIVVFCYEK